MGRRLSRKLDRRVNLHPIPLTQSAFKKQLGVWQALMLHDIKSRFFGNGIGFIITLLWPLAHMLIILIINSGRLAPHGSSMFLYVSTGVVPFITLNYIARFTMMAALQNKSFLQYTIIQPIDLIISRQILEVMSNFIVVTILIIGMAIAGLPVMPVDPGQAALAWLAAIFLGLGFGCLNSVVVMAFPLWTLISIVFFLSAWLTSGVILDPELLPAPIGYYLSFNPLFHAVEWMRQAYYPDFSARLLDKQYLLVFAATCMGIGFIMLRYARSFILKMR